MGNMLKLLEYRTEVAEIERARALPFRQFIKSLRGAINLGLQPFPILSNRYDLWMAWHDSYDSFDPYRSWNNGDLHIISIKTALQPPQYDPYDPYGSYKSWNEYYGTVGGPYRYLHTNDKQYCRTHTTREWLERQTHQEQCMFFVPKTEVSGPKRKTLWILFVFKAWEPKLRAFLCIQCTYSHS